MYAPLWLHVVFLAPLIFKLFIFISSFYLANMVHVPSYPNKEFFEGKIWPRYRGRRAGKQLREREIYNRHYISTITRPRSESHNTQPVPSASRQIAGNCKVIRPEVQAKPGSEHFFVPAFMLSNVMSLSPKIDEVRVTICNANMDFVCITESWLKNHIDDNFVSVSGYNIIRRDREAFDHGGICMYVRDSMRYDVLSNIMNESFEVLWVKTRPKRLPRGISSLIVGTVYHPPGASDPLILDYLYESLSTIEALFPDCGLILLGDFNKLNCTRLQNAFRLKQIVPFATRGQSKLDLILTNLSAFYDVPKKLPPFGLSDHDTVVVHPLSRQDRPKNKFLLKSRDLRATNRLAMRTYLEEVNPSLLVGRKESCEEKTHTFETIIKTGMDTLLPLKSKTVIANEPPWINKQLKSLIHERQTALARGDMASFCRLRNRVNRLRKSCRAKFYESKVDHLRDCAPRRWWKEVKLLGGMQSATRSDPTSVLKHINSGPDSSLTALANTINHAFLAPMNSFSPLYPDVSVDVQNTNLPTVTEFCVFKKLTALNPAKASGPDGIPGWLLKENADLLAPAITEILNCSYSEARLPQSWKEADVAPIPKQTPVYDVNKHLRPISLTPVLSKLAEDFVVDRYVKPAVLAKVDPRQFGTVPGSSTTEALVSMIHAWNSATDGNGATVRVVLFDFKKAFDLIDHQILIRKLNTYDIPEMVISWITDFLTSRKQRVKLGHDCLSEWGLVPAGVPQGTKLGPWLFIVMINELDVPTTDLWKYVDDTTISETISKNQNSYIQAAVDTLANRVTADKFQLNESKCKELRINFGSKNTTSFDSVVVNGMPIELVTSAKILGLNVSSDLKWNRHIDSIIKKAKKRLYSLSQLKRSGLGIHELIQFYSTCIRPITEYACPVFHDGLPAYLSDELEGVQKRAMRIIFPFCSYNESLVESGLIKLSDRRQELVDKLFREVVLNEDNKLHDLLPAPNTCTMNLRNSRKFRPVFKTNRFRNSFIPFNALKA